VAATKCPNVADKVNIPGAPTTTWRMVVGDKENAGHNDCKIDETDSAFQGVDWSENTCGMVSGAEISGPINVHARPPVGVEASR
jgi:hypothetical protein